MAKKLLLRLKPLEPFFFGDENTIRFDKTNRYYVTSINTPSAMTVMGTLRYVLLEQNGLLRNGNYSEQEAKAAALLIGEHSFAPGGDTSYGAIKSVSPLFLMKGDEIYIKTPLNHKTACDKYSPIELGGTFQTSYGSIRLPKDKEFNPKNTVTDGSYVNISTLELCDSVFKDFVKVTNKVGSENEGFMKKCFKCLNADFSFAVVAELEDTARLENSICYMGREKSSFALQVSEGFDIEERIRESEFAKRCEGFSYAFSDIVVCEAVDYTDYAMVGIKNLRYLETRIHNGAVSVSRGATLHNVISAGSVFYGTLKTQILGNDLFGINKIIDFGGSKQ